MFVGSGAGDKWRLLPRSTDGNKSANMMSSLGSRGTFRWREKDSKPRSPGRAQHFLTPPRDAATTNRPGSQNRVFTIAKGRFTVRRASLSLAMISRPGRRASRRRQRGALPANNAFARRQCGRKTTRAIRAVQMSAGVKDRSGFHRVGGSHRPTSSRTCTSRSRLRRETCFP